MSVIIVGIRGFKVRIRKTCLHDLKFTLDLIVIVIVLEFLFQLVNF